MSQIMEDFLTRKVAILVETSCDKGPLNELQEMIDEAAGREIHFVLSGTIPKFIEAVKGYGSVCIVKGANEWCLTYIIKSNRAEEKGFRIVTVPEVLNTRVCTTPEKLEEALVGQQLEVDMRKATEEQMYAFGEFLGSHGFCFSKYSGVINGSIAETLEEWAGQGFPIFVCATIDKNNNIIGANRAHTKRCTRRVSISEIADILPHVERSMSEEDFEAVF